MDERPDTNTTITDAKALWQSWEDEWLAVYQRPRGAIPCVAGNAYVGSMAQVGGAVAARALAVVNALGVVAD